MQFSGDLSEDLVSALERADRQLRSISVSGDLSPASASALARVVREQPIRVSDLARAERVTQPAMTQLVGRLERAGLVHRVADPKDHRAVLVSATEHGVTTWRRRHDERVVSFGEMLSELTDAEVAALESAIPALNALADVDTPAALPSRSETDTTKGKAS